MKLEKFDKEVIDKAKLRWTRRCLRVDTNLRLLKGYWMMHNGVHPKVRLCLPPLCSECNRLYRFFGGKKK